MKQILSKIAFFLQRYRTAITAALFVCVVVQQCTISKLTQELTFVKQKYEQPILPQANESAAQQPTDTVSVQMAEKESLTTVVSTSETTDATTDKPTNWLNIIFSVLLLAAAYWLLARRLGLFPYLHHAKGRIWQDLNGRVVYTLTVKNKARTELAISDAMIEFLGFRGSRRFKVPTQDLPLTLASGTSHAIHVPLQKLLERDQQLLSYKAIRASVTANGKVLKAMPLGVRWK